MALTRSEVKELHQKPKRKLDIQKAINHEDRIALHVECEVKQNAITASRAVTDFLEWVRLLIPADKYKTFLNLFKFPLETNELTEEILTELERIFESKNPVFSYEFSDDKYKSDWIEYKKKTGHGFISFWKEKVWQDFKTTANSILIIDLPETQQPGDPYPQPYAWILNINQVIDIETGPEGIEWIIYNQPGNRIAQMDDTWVRIYQLKESGEIVGDPILEKAHGLGYCPATWVHNEPINKKDHITKRHPLSKQLSNLDWVQFFQTSKRHLDLYAPYPIYSGYEQACDFQNPETGEFCDGGYLKDKAGSYLVTNSGLYPCPVCSGKRIVGAGSFIEIPIPNKEDGQPDLSNPVKMLPADTDSLKYNVDELNRLRREIYDNVVGRGSETLNDQAKNQLQINASYENRKAVLANLKTKFEEAQEFTESTMCRLRYGAAFLGASINYGTEFYLKSMSELLAAYDLAKKSGVSDSELDRIYDQILETEYKNNPQMLKRMMTLKHLEPYRHTTKEELRTLKESGMIDKTEFIIKINFVNFIARFERENQNIVQFGNAADFDTKIDSIYKQLKKYANEQTTETTIQLTEGAK